MHWNTSFGDFCSKVQITWGMNSALMIMMKLFLITQKILTLGGWDQIFKSLTFE